MPAIITNKMRITTGDSFQNEIQNLPVYVYFGGTTPWADEELPDDAVDSTEGRIAALNDVQGLKRLQRQDIVSVLPRTDWIENTVYDQYTDKANLIDDKNPDTNDFYRFYVVTDEFNVYKCLSNNYRSQSTTKPSGTSTTPFETPDGYKWKFMYTIRSTDAFRFMTPNWVPCYTIDVDDGSAQWNVQQAAVPGTIDHIEVIDGGENYDSSDPPSVTITGDGSGASAEVEIDDVTGEVVAVNVLDPGQDYTTASVSISGGVGAGAEADPLISPIRGHGADARDELGATFKMFRITIDGSEGGILPTEIDYRRTGIISEPKSGDSGLELFISDVNLFQVGETVEGSSSGATATIRSINRTRSLLYVENVTGTFTSGETVTSNAISSAQLDFIVQTNRLPLTDPVVAGTDYISLTGDLVYFTTREPITRGVNQIEELRLVVAY